MAQNERFAVFVVTIWHAALQSRFAELLPFAGFITREDCRAAMVVVIGESEADTVHVGDDILDSGPFEWRSIRRQFRPEALNIGWCDAGLADRHSAIIPPCAAK